MARWSDRRQEKRERLANLRRRWAAEYQEKIDAGEPDALEAGRDHGDLDAVPWRTEVGLSLAVVVMLGMFLAIVVLIVFFLALGSVVESIQGGG